MLDARPDTLDFRDRMFEPTLIEVQTRRPLEEYRKAGVPILDQGQEGACTGFGLATVVHYLSRTRAVVSDKSEVSPRMLYNMARRYDEWPGENYSGSSARGAMKGWHKHGVCSRGHWVYDRSAEKQDTKLFAKRYEEALRRPLGAYFRVNHKDLIAMHAAISEVGILYATAQVHEGWQNVTRTGAIEWQDKMPIIGGHAFALVGYDEKGFWLQNSWGTDWGKDGFAQVTYDDWLANGSDIWVARLGAPVILASRESVSSSVAVAAQGSRSYVFCDLRPHIISLGNNGKLKTDGTYGTSKEDVEEIFETVSEYLDRQSGPSKHLLLYGHGGLTAEDSAIQKIADLRPALLTAGVFPISIIWRTDIWSTLRNILQDALARRRPEGFLDDAKDFMLDRLDDALEPIARVAGGRKLWAEMQENASLASAPGGGLLVVLDQLRKLRARHRGLQIHLVGHSAGSILLGGIARASQASPAAQQVPIETCTLWAPACTIDFYRANFLPAIQSGGIKRFGLFTLTDRAEQDDDCANLYHKSLLYLVSHAFERELRKPGFGNTEGEPLLGMEKYVKRLSPKERPQDWVLAPNVAPEGQVDASKSTTHGGFDDDPTTLKATLARILNKSTALAGVADAFPHHRSQHARRDVRRSVMSQTRAMGPA